MNMWNLLDLNLGFITNLRGPQLLIIVLVILLLFGSKRLPDIARGFGKAIREFRKSAFEVEKDFKAAMEETPAKAASPETVSTVTEPAENKTQV